MGDGYNSKPYRGRPTNSHKRGGQQKGCCSMVEAGRAVRRRRFRLAVRYVRMTPRFLARRVVA